MMKLLLTCLARYGFIEQEKLNYPINPLCRVMQVKCCNYYAYRRGKTYNGSPLTAKIKECFNLNARRYGAGRIAVALKIGRNTAARRVLKREGLQAIQPKSFKPNTTDSKHGFGYNENLLKDAANQPQTSGEVFIGERHLFAITKRCVLLFGGLAG